MSGATARRFDSKLLLPVSQECKDPVNFTFHSPPSFLKGDLMAEDQPLSFEVDVSCPREPTRCARCHLSSTWPSPHSLTAARTPSSL